MAISLIGTVPSLPIPFASGIENIRRMEARGADLALIVGGVVPGAPEIEVEFSDTGRLLASVAGLADAGVQVEAGVMPDTERVVSDTQRLVDSVNALNLGTSLAMNTVLDLLATTSGAPVESGVPGLAVLPLGVGGVGFVLAVNSDELAVALDDDAIGTTRQLNGFAAPLAQSALRNVTSAGESLTSATGNPLLSVRSNDIQLVLGADDGIVPIVPDLTLENARLREALADSLLQDIVTDAANVVTTQLAELGTQAASESETRPPINASAASQSEERSVSDDNARTAALAPSAVAANPVVSSPNPLTTAPANAAQTDALLSLEALATTPLEQVNLLAGNPMVAGAVAAFQVPVDVSDRVSRTVPLNGLAVMNPTEAVAALDPVAANLANAREQRREQSPNQRINQWLAMQPRLL